MLYEQIVDEELAIMDEEPDEPSKTLSAHEIQVPLRSLMRLPVTIEMGASIQEAINLMIENRIGAILVVSDGVLKGIFGERDVLLKILNKPVGDVAQIPVEHFMKIDPHTAQVEDSLDTAILHMAKGGFRHIPVVNELNQPVGMVSTRHVVSYIIDHFPQEVLTLPPKPVREAMQAREGA
jgi:CBS domain-containing protein